MKTMKTQTVEWLLKKSMHESTIYQRNGITKENQHWNKTGNEKLIVSGKVSKPHRLKDMRKRISDLEQKVGEMDCSIKEMLNPKTFRISGILWKDQTYE